MYVHFDCTLQILATNEVKANLESKIDRIDQSIMYNTALFRRKRLDFSNEQQEELSEEIDMLRERRDVLESLRNLSTKYDIKKFNAMVNRASIKLIREKDLG